MAATHVAIQGAPEDDYQQELLIWQHGIQLIRYSALWSDSYGPSRTRKDRHTLVCQLTCRPISCLQSIQNIMVALKLRPFSHQNMLFRTAFQRVLLHFANVSEPSREHGDVELGQKILHNMADTLFARD